jgi:hypothetical protein
VTAPGGGGNATVSVTAPSGCSWDASTASSWITVSPASGSGNGTATLTAASNITSSARTDVVTVAGQTVTVSQPLPSACTGTLSPRSATMPQAGGTGSMSLTAADSCSWTVKADATWIKPAKSSGTGSGAIGYTVDPNTGKRSRSGTMTVAGQAFTVKQEGQKPGKVGNVTVTTTP